MLNVNQLLFAYIVSVIILFLIFYAFRFTTLFALALALIIATPVIVAQWDGKYREEETFSATIIGAMVALYYFLAFVVILLFLFLAIYALTKDDLDILFRAFVREKGDMCC
jgi:hypothetical protein